MKRITLFLLCLLAVCGTRAQQDDDHLHVVIVNGGMSKLMNHERYWNDCSFLYRTLRQDYHLPRRCFTLLMSDGGDPGRDMLLDGAKGFASSPDDLDDDSERDVFLPATLESVTTELTALANKLTPDDHLLLFLMDHGGSDEQGSFAWMWDGGRLYASQLASLLSAFRVASMCVVMGQCYSGGFVPALEREGRVLMTACAADELSWECSDRCYDEFVYHWTCALAGHEPDGTIVAADRNADGQVSMAEAFAYAQTHDRRDETPQYSSMPQELGERWTLPWAREHNGIVEVKAAPAAASAVWSLTGVRRRQLATGLNISHGRKILKKP